MNYFEGCESVSEVKKRFRNLMFENHPDRHEQSKSEAQNAITAAIIALYKSLLQSMSGTQSRGSDGKTRTYRYNAASEESVIEKISELLALRMSGVQIQLIGVWIWVTGETRAVKAELKEAGMRWHSKRRCWYFKPYGGRTRYAKSQSLEDLARSYGSKTYQNEEQKQQAHSGALGA